MQDKEEKLETLTLHKTKAFGWMCCTCHVLAIAIDATRETRPGKGSYMNSRSLKTRKIYGQKNYEHKFRPEGLALGQGQSPASGPAAGRPAGPHAILYVFVYYSVHIVYIFSYTDNIKNTPLVYIKIFGICFW